MSQTLCHVLGVKIINFQLVFLIHSSPIFVKILRNENLQDIKKMKGGCVSNSGVRTEQRERKLDETRAEGLGKEQSP